jgi:Putative lumazine-binding
MKSPVILLIALLPLGLFSQTKAEKKAVEAVVNSLFDAMRSGDSALVRRIFTPETQLCTAAEGAKPWSCTPGESFIRAIGSPHKEVWDERISHLKIEIDGPLATAWMKYDFYLDQKYLHKGVDAMTLYRSADGWKIIWLADTRIKN